MSAGDAGPASRLRPLSRFVARVRRVGSRIGTASVVLLAALVAIVLASLVAPGAAMVAVSADSEMVQVRVVDAESMRIALRGACRESVGFDDEPVQCFDAIMVEPRQGALVTYAQPRGGELTVAVEGGWALHRSDGGLVADATDDTLLLRVGTRRERSETDGGQRLILPVNGAVAVGSFLYRPGDNRDIQLVLGGARLLVFGRAMPRLFGLPLSRGPFRADALYLSQEITIPGGSMIGSAGAASDGRFAARWWGFADVSLGASGAPMKIEASTNTNGVELYTPAPFESTRARGRASPDIIALSLGARLADDPNLRWLYGIVALIAVVFGFALQLHSTRP